MKDYAVFTLDLVDKRQCYTSVKHSCHFSFTLSLLVKGVYSEEFKLINDLNQINQITLT